jgi:hypothetical protein
MLNLKGIWRKQFWRNGDILAFVWRDWGKPCKSVVRTGGVSAEIRIERLPNTSLQRYRTVALNKQRITCYRNCSKFKMCLHFSLTCNWFKCWTEDCITDRVFVNFISLCSEIFYASKIYRHCFLLSNLFIDNKTWVLASRYNWDPDFIPCGCSGSAAVMLWVKFILRMFLDLMIFTGAFTRYARHVATVCLQLSRRKL